MSPRFSWVLSFVARQLMRLNQSRHVVETKSIAWHYKNRFWFKLNNWLFDLGVVNGRSPPSNLLIRLPASMCSRMGHSTL